MPIREPAASRKTLITTAAVVWALVGLFLIIRAGFYLPDAVAINTTITLAAGSLGILLGLVKGNFVFARLAHRNTERIYQLSPHKEKICVFAFQAWQSYLIVVLMIGLGVALRLSPLPRPYLVGVYLLIGTALLLGSRAYLKR